ncbi:MAG: alpha-galactosidase [Armatimonadota bacterium]
MNATPLPPVTTREDMAKSREWIARYLSDPTQLPIAFILDGLAVRGIPMEWQPVTQQRRIDANIMETIFEGADPATGLQLRVECTEYRDYPVVEWVAWLTNTGSQATPIIRDLLALDGTFKGSAPALYHCNGDFYSAEGYTSQRVSLPEGETVSVAPRGGRSCDGAFPYYRILFDEGGVSLAIGWPTQWAATFTGVAEGIHVQAGQELTHLRLLPGERIRTPHMTVMTWTGDETRAVNLWRRWYHAHILPRPDGRPLQPLLACAATDDGNEFTAATEENQLRYMERFVQRGIRPDVWWIDAGWYPCYNIAHERTWFLTGTWEPDPERFPHGLRPVSDGAARQDADLLLWFEPERVVPLTRLEEEHPEWLLHVPDGDTVNTHTGLTRSTSLLNLGNPACRRWLTDHVCRLIQENGIKIYRQDHNFAPLEYWRLHDAPDRQGMSENLHVQGYLQFWDDLLARNPGLWIDSCASGGRRNDLETMRRSVPLHYTDYGYGEHPVKLAFHRTLLEWIPYFKECTLSYDLDGVTRFDHQVDSYSFHCALAPMLFPTLDIRRDDYDFALARIMIALWRRAVGLLLFGDYYPLTPFNRRPDEWVAQQFDRPEESRGFLQAIRFPQAPNETLTIHPRALKQEAVYCLENAETGESRDIAGEELQRDGFTFALSPRSGALWFYRVRG